MEPAFTFITMAGKWMITELHLLFSCKMLLYIFPGTLLYIVSHAEQLKLYTCKPSVSCKHSRAITIGVLYYRDSLGFFIVWPVGNEKVESMGEHLVG